MGSDCLVSWILHKQIGPPQVVSRGSSLFASILKCTEQYSRKEFGRDGWRGFELLRTRIGQTDFSFAEGGLLNISISQRPERYS